MCGLKEKNFEADIESWLLDEGGYEKGNQDNYDKERAIDMTALINYISKTQPKQWQRYLTIYGDNAERQLYKVFQQNVLDSGLIYVLRHGINDRGVELRVCYFAPASDLNEDLVEKYQANVLTETRQFHYSLQNDNSIDMVLSLNGIPVIAIELKNQFTGQSIENSKRQWREDRDPKEFLFHFNNRILVYFGADLYEVCMATELNKEKTFFMPFNQGSNGAGNVGGAGNPQAENGEYVTKYFWEKVLRRDMLLSILQRYISVQKEEKLKIIVDKHGKEKEKKESSVKIIFPRYHQLDVVEKLVEATKQQTDGHNYLIEHSAGSGKSNSIAWLTYRLSSLHDLSQKDMFNSVFVITDRRVLNKQLRDTILSFEYVKGTIEVINDSDPSTKLRDTINDDNARIVICTLHRFPVIYKELTSRSGKHYAVVVDEAHSSQSGKSAEKLKAALADTDEALKEMAEIEGKTEEELETQKDALMEDLLSQGQHANLSFYAFTATPKPKTLQTFGIPYQDAKEPDKEKFRPFHIYSMKQAIEEGYILDVLQNFTHVSTAYEIGKQIEDNPEYEETPATKAIKAYHDNHQHVIEQKTAIFVEKFREVTLHSMEGAAKAMIVCSSRAHAVRYYLQMKKYCEEKGYKDVNPLVAFSGTVTFREQEYTETKLNSTEERTISESRLPLYFASDLYNVLIVAEKYQTGFDEPLLHTMFVDKRLKNVKAVQTLSRLNRWEKRKVDTYILDFSNTSDEIKKAFEPFYKGTELVNPVDVNYVYKFHKDIEQYHLWTIEDEEQFSEIYAKHREQQNVLGALSNCYKPVLDKFGELEEEQKFEVRSKVKNFIRFYSYMAIIARTFDTKLLKAYYYAFYLYKLLPKTAHEHPDLNKKIMLINSQFKEGTPISISLEGGVDIKGENPKAGVKPEDNRDLLKNIIDKVNIMYKGQFSEADRVIVESIYDKMMVTAKKKLTKQANNTDEKQFEESIFPQIFDEVARNCYSEQMDSFGKLFENTDFYKNVMTQMAKVMYENYKQQDEFKYDPQKFRDGIVKKLNGCLDEALKEMRPIDEIADNLVKVITAKTIDTLDGANEMLLDSMNRLVCQTKMKIVDKRRHLSTIVTKFELFLKKIYYQINGKELQSKEVGKGATLTDAIMTFDCLRILKHSHDAVHQQLYQYLDLLRTLRNAESHGSPNATEKEINAMIQVVIAMYVYVMANTITDIEMNEATSMPHNIYTREPLNEFEHRERQFGMAAEEGNDSEN